MGEERTSGGNTGALPVVVVALSIFWMLVRPDLWAWALCVAIVAIIMVVLAHNAGMRRGRESARSAASVPIDSEKPDEKTIAEAQLEAFETGLAEADLFAYELKHGLVPEGNSENNPGYGPMDFNEWREWKRREFERTGNLWHNHPDGLPPKEGSAT